LPADCGIISYENHKIYKKTLDINRR
jgi:hypothetical protein